MGHVSLSGTISFMFYSKLTSAWKWGTWLHPHHYAPLHSQAELCAVGDNRHRVTGCKFDGSVHTERPRPAAMVLDRFWEMVPELQQWKSVPLWSEVRTGSFLPPLFPQGPCLSDHQCKHTLCQPGDQAQNAPEYQADLNPQMGYEFTLSESRRSVQEALACWASSSYISLGQN